MKVKGNVVPFHGMKVYRGIQVELYQITLTLNGGQWSTSSPGWCIPGKDFRHPLLRRLGGPKKRYGQFGEEKNLLPLQGSSSP
jgi:hypothetical protein